MLDTYAQFVPPYRNKVPCLFNILEYTLYYTLSFTLFDLYKFPLHTLTRNCVHCSKLWVLILNWKCYYTDKLMQGKFVVCKGQGHNVQLCNRDYECQNMKDLSSICISEDMAVVQNFSTTCNNNMNR